MLSDIIRPTNTWETADTIAGPALFLQRYNFKKKQEYSDILISWQNNSFQRRTKPRRDPAPIDFSAASSIVRA